MAKTVRDSNLVSREARARLKVRKHPYWRAVDRGLHIGYFKGSGGGTWLIRRYLGGGRYQEEKVGVADDKQEADGEGILSFYQAQAGVRSRAAQIARNSRLEAAGPTVTVRVAVQEYLEQRKAKTLARSSSGEVVADGGYRLRNYVLNCDLAEAPLADLDAAQLADWQGHVTATILRSGRAMRPATVARTVTDLRAALNAAARKHAKHLPADFERTVRNGLKTQSAGTPATRPPQVLSDADIRATLAAAEEVDTEGHWAGDLYMMLVVLAATGSRFSQVARITVADVQPGQQRIMVPVSRKGQGPKQVTHTARRIGLDVLTLLRPAIAGRKGDEPLLQRPRWKQTDKLTWRCVGRSAWLNPSELSRPWKAIRTKAALSADVVPYAFRHSSIVRALREGLPVRLVAAQHDTSSQMIERHYAAYVVDAMDELASRAVVPLVSVPARRLNVVDKA